MGIPTYLIVYRDPSPLLRAGEHTESLASQPKFS